MHYINVQTHKFNIVKTTAQFTEYFGKDIAKTGEYEVSDDFCGYINRIAEKMCPESQMEGILEFIDIGTIEKRLRGKNSIAHEFIEQKIGWCRSRFLPVDYDENGRLLHVLFCIECIEEEKKRENNLLYLAETDLMTGLCNRGSGERRITAFLKERTAGLLCLLDPACINRPVSIQPDFRNGLCEILIRIPAAKLIAFTGWEVAGKIDRMSFERTNLLDTASTTGIKSECGIDYRSCTA